LTQITHLDEGTFLPDRINRKFGNNIGYSIKSETELNDFILSVINDLSLYILPNFEKPKNLVELLEFYKKYEFWGNQLEKQIIENKLL